MNELDIDKFIDETRISEVTLDDCFQKQSSLRAYYGAVASRAEAFASQIKAAFEYKEAQLFKEHRERFAEEGIKVTEKMIENAVKTDPAWLRAKMKLIDAQCQADIARAMVMSLVDRRDMLIQLGADRRDENKGQMRMLVAQQESERMAQLQRQTQAILSKRN